MLCSTSSPMRSALYIVTLSLGVLAIAIFAIPRFTLPTFGFRSRPMTEPTPTPSLATRVPRVGHAFNRHLTDNAVGATESSKVAPKGQVYFLSHGGPPTMFETNSPAYKAWQKYGKLVEQANPRGLVVVSAHWEANSGPGVIVYDFYGFPKNFYQQTFESKGNAQMLADVKSALGNAGIQTSTQKRGLDHGVWVPFLVAFSGKTDIPIIQVSLPGDSNPVSAAKLGRALSKLRDEGYSIMGSGQVVHNLRDYMTGGSGSYGKIFLSAIESALNSDDPVGGSVGLFRHPVYRQAHPSPEHLLPLVVAAGAVRADDGIEEIFTKADGALSWGMWIWKSKA